MKKMLSGLYTAQLS